VLEIVLMTDRLRSKAARRSTPTARAGYGCAHQWASWRDSRPLKARLAWVSADSVEDKRTGASYFIARIELAESRTEIARRMPLHPGQRTEILLLTGERTLLDHIIDPLLRSINRAFRA
jgi:hypothetical protein